MGFFSAVSETVQESRIKQVQAFLVDGETLECVYSSKPDFVALTSKRIIFVDTKVFLSETGVVSIPYSKIEEISIINDKAWTISDTIGITTYHKEHELHLIKDGLEFYNKLAKHIC